MSGMVFQAGTSPMKHGTPEHRNMWTRMARRKGSACKCEDGTLTMEAQVMVVSLRMGKSAESIQSLTENGIRPLNKRFQQTRSLIKVPGPSSLEDTCMGDE
jgi:hypothetical protein